MPTYRTKVGPNAQVQLPADLIERLSIREGAEVEFFLTLDGDVFFHAITETAASWKDLIPTDRRVPPMSIREMDESVMEGVVQDHERIRREAKKAPPSDDPGLSAAE